MRKYKDLFYVEIFVDYRLQVYVILILLYEIEWFVYVEYFIELYSVQKRNRDVSSEASNLCYSN